MNIKCIYFHEGPSCMGKTTYIRKQTDYLELDFGQLTKEIKDYKLFDPVSNQVTGFRFIANAVFDICKMSSQKRLIKEVHIDRSEFAYICYNHLHSSKLLENFPMNNYHEFCFKRQIVYDKWFSWFQAQKQVLKNLPLINFCTEIAESVRLCFHVPTVILELVKETDEKNWLSLHETVNRDLDRKLAGSLGLPNYFYHQLVMFFCLIQFVDRDLADCRMFKIDVIAKDLSLFKLSDSGVAQSLKMV